MFSKILGKGSAEESKNDKLSNKISKMDLADMRLYVNDKLNEYSTTEFGLVEIIKKLTLPNESTSNLYLKEDDQDSKKKKVFDLVILVLSNRYTSINVIELVQIFLETYEEIIKKYDKENKQIYEKKIRESMSIATDKIGIKSDIAKKMRTLK